MQQLSATTQMFMTSTDTNRKNQVAAIHNLEVQIGQISNLLDSKAQGSLPSNTKTNPKEHIKAITLLSGWVLEQNHDTRTEFEDKKDMEKRKKNIRRSLI